MRTPLSSLAALAVLALGSRNASAQQAPEPLDTAYRTYGSDWVSLPLGLGLRIPSYNRVDGVVLPWGPDVKLGSRVTVTPTVTYRSHIGDVDPFARVTAGVGSSDTIHVEGGRSTFTNDRWIRSDLSNSLAALAVGSDARNYFRADRGTIEVAHTFVQTSMSVTPSVGVLHEYAWSTGSAVRHTSAPWSAFGRTDSLRMRRVNPSILKGHTTSGLGGLRLLFDDNETTARLIARVEHAFETPPLQADESGDFTQLTVDAKSKFPTFGTQYFAFRGHAVATGGDAPPQRYAYLGGSSTLSTVDLLAMGGDRLVYVEGEYFYPLKAPVLQFVGAPLLSLRYAVGSAGVEELPDFIQNVGIGVGLKFVEAKYHFDPSYEDLGFNRRSAFSVSLSLDF
jgi:hypothetical protein